MISFPALKSESFQASSVDQGVTRAALDIGSGKIKLLVAKVCGQTNIQEIFSKIVRVGFARDFEERTDGVLSESIQKLAVIALKELKIEAQVYGATEYQGIATAVFRKAKNGSAFLQSLADETGIPLKIVSQEAEGMIGFHTAMALSPEIEENNMIAWDSGTSSFQIIAKENDQYSVYEGPLGVVSTTKAFLEEVRGESYSSEKSINPMTLTECQSLARVIKDKISKPAWLKNSLSDPKTTVVCIGDAGSIFSIAAKAIGSNRYTMDQVQNVVQNLAGLSNEDLTDFATSSPETLVIRVVLLSTVMEAFGIHEILFKESSGSTLGILTSPHFWI